MRQSVKELLGKEFRENLTKIFGEDLDRYYIALWIYARGTGNTERLRIVIFGFRKYSDKAGKPKKTCRASGAKEGWTETNRNGRER